MAAQLTATNGLVARAEIVMDRPGDEFFAGAGFAEEQDGGRSGGDFLDLLADFADGGVFAEDARGQAVARGIFFAEDYIFAEKFLLGGAARPTRSFKCSRSTGFWRKSKAPSFMAVTASSTEPESGEEQDGHCGIGLLGFS